MKLKGKLIYVASPYYHDNPLVMSTRYDAVAYFCYLMLRHELTPFSPICHWHPMKANGNTFKDIDNDLIRVNMEMLKKCDILLVLQLNGWKESHGVNAEVAQARELGLEVRYILSTEAITLFGGGK